MNIITNGTVAPRAHTVEYTYRAACALNTQLQYQIAMQNTIQSFVRRREILRSCQNTPQLRIHSALCLAGKYDSWRSLVPQQEFGTTASISAVSLGHTHCHKHVPAGTLHTSNTCQTPYGLVVITCIGDIGYSWSIDTMGSGGTSDTTTLLTLNAIMFFVGMNEEQQRQRRWAVQ